jgi:hypothetical protein
MYLYKTVGDRMENIFITNFEKRSIQTLMATQHNHSNGLEHVIVSRKMVTVLASQLEMDESPGMEWILYVRAKSKGGHGLGPGRRTVSVSVPVPVPVRAVPPQREAKAMN